MEKRRKVRVEIYATYDRATTTSTNPRPLVFDVSVIYRGKKEDASQAYSDSLILSQVKYIIEVSPENPVYDIIFTKGPESNSKMLFHGEVPEEQKKKLRRYLRDEKLIRRVQEKLVKRKKLDNEKDRLEKRLEQVNNDLLKIKI